MKDVSRRVPLKLGVLFCAIVLSSFAVAGPPPPPPPPVPVRVENTPLPVTGTINSAVTGTVSITGTPNVNVVNTPSVNAQQSGPWSVSITGTPSVSLSTSTPLTVTSASDPSSATFTPVSAGANGTFASGACQASASATTISSGQLLVVENVGAEVVLGTGQKLASLSINPGTPSGLGEWSPTYQTDDGTNAYFGASQAMRFYVTAGNVVSWSAQATNASDSGSCHFSFSGYLINVQP